MSVYTRIAPRGSLLYPQISSLQPSLTPSIRQSNVPSSKSQPTMTQENNAPPVLQPAATLTSSRINSNLEFKDTKASLIKSTAVVSEITAKSKGTVPSANNINVRQDCPVMNETLSVINEHITDLKSPRLGISDGDRHVFSDSGSEYSNSADPRLSYVHGEETDEEEAQISLSREQISNWTSEEVAEHLYSEGVESKHCEIIRDQEITGDILLAMDQSTIFLKEFDFGSVGRRLKTWQKIKSIQDDVNGDTSSKRSTLNNNPEHEQESGRIRSRSTNSTNTFPRMSHSENRNIPINPRLSHKSSLRNELPRVASSSSTKLSQSMPRSEGTRNSTPNRKIHQFRESFSKPSGTILFGSPTTDRNNIKANALEDEHRKKGSFDSTWTMQSLSSPLNSDRPIPSQSFNADKGSNTRNSGEALSRRKASVSSLEILDCGFFSSSETNSGRRNASQKRESISLHSKSHSRRSSNVDEYDLRGSPGQNMHTRLGSIESIRDSMAQSAAVKYYGLGNNNTRHRTPSEASVSGSSRTYVMKDNTLFISNTLTKSEGESGNTLDIRPDKDDSSGPMKQAPNGRTGLRAISNAVTGHEKLRYIAQPPDPPPKNSPKQSPSATSSSTPSGALSFDLHSPGPTSVSSLSTSNSNARVKKKSKKETSAYTRGLERKKPQDAILSADYSGWMKKKSTNLMASWKPRLFILKGRRLSYYYSEDDDSEKGLIDISFHRVLPADNDRLTGLHATLTGATHSPSNLLTDNTVASIDAAESPSNHNKSNDSMFIFKLVPPKIGLQRGVTFTKPTVHYFAVPNIKQGRLWMAALMKATIERDDSVVLKSTYQQKTISLTKARAMRHRPPALMNLNEQVEAEVSKTPETDLSGLDISSIVYNTISQEDHSCVSNLPSDKIRRQSVKSGNINERNLSGNGNSQPNTA